MFSVSLFDGFQFLDLLDEIGFLVVELLILGPVRVELGEEVHELVLISKQNVQNGLRFVGVGNKHLKKNEKLY